MYVFDISGDQMIPPTLIPKRGDGFPGVHTRDPNFQGAHTPVQLSPHNTEQTSTQKVSLLTVRSQPQRVSVEPGFLVPSHLHPRPWALGTRVAHPLLTGQHASWGQRSEVNCGCWIWQSFSCVRVLCRVANHHTRRGLHGSAAFSEGGQGLLACSCGGW